MKIKTGNVFKHAQTLGKKVALKKPATKKAAVKKRVRPVAAKKAAPVRPPYQYRIEVRKTATGKWMQVGMGGNDAESVKRVARLYASNYPRYAFRVL